VQNNPHTTLITGDAPIKTSSHGGRAKCLQRLVRLELPVPRTVALSFEAVKKLAAGALPDLKSIMDVFDRGTLLVVRPSSEDPDWGGPGAVLNIGMNDATYAGLCATLGEAAATALYTRFI
jgi:pyruvate,orthophosphate dikinase